MYAPQGPQPDQSYTDLRKLWSNTGFSCSELSQYAQAAILKDTKRGVMTMSLMMLCLIVVGILLYYKLDLSTTYFHGYAIIALLSAHIYFSARATNDIRALNLLGITLLTLSATAFLSIAHQTQSFSTLLFANVVLLFMIVPMVPWGLREATTVIVILYGMMSLSTGVVAHRFTPDALWTLQFLMGAAALIALALVARGVQVKKHDLNMQFDLEQARDNLYKIANIDPLTGAWNRRYLPHALDNLVKQFGSSWDSFHFALFDIDKFKSINDTYGHDLGDDVLKLIAAAFRERLANQGFFIRLGGDEFALLLIHDTPEIFIEETVSHIKEEAMALQKQPGISVRMSYGRVQAPLARSTDLELLYKRADKAMYEVKSRRAGDTVDSTRENLDESGSWDLVGS